MDNPRIAIRALILSLATAIVCAQPAAAAVVGNWSAILSSDGKRAQYSFFEISGLDTTRLGYSETIDKASSLTAEDFAVESEPRRFEWFRDFGRIAFEGAGFDSFAGTFEFTADEALAAELVEQGYRSTTEQDLLQLAMAGVSVALSRGLHESGYQGLETRQLIQLTTQGASIEYIRGFIELDYEVDIDQVLLLRIHGIEPEWVGEFLKLELARPSVDDLVQLKLNGVRPEFARDLIAAGIDRPSVHDLIKLRTHGVTAKYVELTADAGFTGITIDELIRLRSHGISAGYLRQMASLGLGGIPVDDMIKLQSSGIQPDYVRALSDARFDVRHVDELVRLKLGGVQAQTVVELVDLGYDFDADELIELAANDVTAAFVRRLAEAGRDNLSVDELVRIRADEAAHDGSGRKAA